MAQPHPGTRGSYAKGLAKREEILERALDVIAREGYRGASVRELAEAVGLSSAGLLHYFDSKEELFTEILRKRDEVDRALFGATADASAPFGDARDGYLGVIRHNTDVPGLVELFSRMSVEAADPAHPAHRFLLERGAGLRDNFAATVARLVQAVSDGMQLQWMLDPDVDMGSVIEALFEILSTTQKELP